MKLIILFSLILSINTFAEELKPKPIKLQCGEAYSHIIVHLNPEAYTGNYNHAVGASIMHHYSSAPNMICAGVVNGNQYDINCAGYYWEKDLTELKIRTEGDTVYALWETSEGYGKQEMKSACTLIYK